MVDTWAEEKQRAFRYDVEADSLFAAGVFGSILSLNNNGRFVGDKHAGFSRGMDNCFEVDGER